jgi:hypothetical protein
MAEHRKSLVLTRWRDTAIIFLAVYIAYVFFRGLDPVEMLVADVQPWDSEFYQKLSDQMVANGLSGLSGIPPYSYRIVLPALATLARISLGSTYSEASHFINLISTFLVTVFCFNLWVGLGLSRLYAYTGVILVTAFWLGPLRYSIFYPGGQFGFEILMTSLSFLALKTIYSAEQPSGFVLPSLVLIVATLGRENILFLVVINIVVLWMFRVRRMGSRVVPALVALGSSLLGFGVARNLVQSTGEYSIFKTILTYGWFHFNVAESLYMLVYAFGPLFLFFLLCLSFAPSRKYLLSVLDPANSIDNKLIAGFCLSSFIFAFVGGTDSDRFLLWSLPFFFFVGLTSLRAVVEILSRGRKRIAIVLVFVLAAALWSRFYVPAIPHLLFTDHFNSQARVKTNLNPSLYRGLPFLLPLREKLVEVSDRDAYGSVRIGKPEQLPKAFVAEKVAVSFGGVDVRSVNEQATGNLYHGSYRFAANNIPFPLGFAHNQNELLAIHPYHGDPRLRAALLSQWIFLYLLLVAGISLAPPGSTRS